MKKLQNADAQAFLNKTLTDPRYTRERMGELVGLVVARTATVSRPRLIWRLSDIFKLNPITAGKMADKILNSPRQGKIRSTGVLGYFSVSVYFSDDLVEYMSTKEFVKDFNILYVTASSISETITNEGER